jgi:hypothetical protein
LAYFIQWLLAKSKLARSFSFMFRYRDDARSQNNPKFDNFVDRLYPSEFGIKDTSDITKSASYFDLHHEINCEDFTTKETHSK